jgi:predicted alpha/beta-hydrolase family hydrolase
VSGPREHRFGVHTGLLWLPDDATSLLVLAHGAGAGMRHAFLEAIAGALARCRVATLRFEFPYAAAGARRPDPKPVLVETVCAAAAEATRLAGELPLFAGGKSMGGRMTSHAAAETALAAVRGLVFFGFPLHPAGRPGTTRADHLAGVRQPMLFLQGTRDTLADLALLTPVCERLGPRARLHRVEGADHGFHVLKRSGRSDADVIEELATEVERFAEAQARASAPAKS